MLYGDLIFYARRSRASHELRRSESEKAKLEELSNNISERRCELKANEPVRERSERAAILSDTLVRSRQASYCCIRNIVYYFRFHFEMHICYLYSMIDSNIIFGF